MLKKKEKNWKICEDNNRYAKILTFFFGIRPPSGLLPVLGPLEQYMMPTLDLALIISSRAGADLGRMSD